MRSFLLLAPVLASASAIPSNATRSCKTTPNDSSWPTSADWNSLNNTINGTLLRTTPATSACWFDNPFGSTVPCEVATDKWSNGTWHSQQPESIDYQVYANNTCLPTGVSGYSAEKGCSIDAFPQYIVNATDEGYIAYAMEWASDRNIRITVKEGTYATIGLQGGPGVRDTPEERWGALLPAWRSAYLHFISTGATVDSIAAGSPKKALDGAAKWYEENCEPMWREWASDSGAYMNETNPFNKDFAKDYYGENYEKLRSIKAKYDPKESLFVFSGVGSDA